MTSQYSTFGGFGNTDVLYGITPDVGVYDNIQDVDVDETPLQTSELDTTQCKHSSVKKKKKIVKKNELRRKRETAD